MGDALSDRVEREKWLEQFEDRVNLRSKWIRSDNMWYSNCPKCGQKFKGRWAPFVTEDAMECCIGLEGSA